MASFADLSQDDFDDNVVPTSEMAESPSQVVDQLLRSNKLQTIEGLPSRPHVVSPEIMSFPQPPDIPLRSGSFDDMSYDFDDELLEEDPADHAFYHSGTLHLYDDDDDEQQQQQQNSSTDESDIEAFLEYARDVVEYNNAPYDPKSFQDFEQLLGECIAQCFQQDEDDDKDSLASDKESTYSGYDHETSTLSFHQKQLLNKPMISEFAASRLKGMIATKRNEERGLTTINGSFVPPESPRNTAMEVDNSDDSLMETAATEIALQSLKDSIVARERNFKNHSECEVVSDSDSASKDEKTQRPKRPKCRRMRKNRKEKRELPPRNRPSKDIKGTLGNRSASGSPSASGTSISAILSTSPIDKEKVLKYLKQYAPQLYKSVVERMDREDQAASMTQLERGYHNDSGFLCTPEKPVPRAPPSVISRVTASTNKPRLPPSFTIEVPLPPQWKPCVDTSSVIKPSIVKAGVTFYAVGASSDVLKNCSEYDHVTVSLTEDIERVLHGMLQKQAQIKSQPACMQRMLEDQLLENHENMAVRGMALIHKFRAKRKAVLQAKFMQRSQDAAAQTPSATTSTTTSSKTPSPPNSTNSALIQEHKRSPQQLDSYMDPTTYHPSSLSTNSSPASSIEEQRQKLRRLKEKRRRNMSSSLQRQESRESLLQTESSPPEIVTRQKSSSSSDGLSSMTKSSPFRHIKFPLQKKKDSNYEALTPESSRLSVVKSEAETGSDACSPLLQEGSPHSSMASSSGYNAKNNSFSAGGLKSDDLNKIMIDPQSPECVSPIRDCCTWDLSDHSQPILEHDFIASSLIDMHTRGLCDLSDMSSRVPTVFEDNNSSTGHERLHSSNNTSAWSEMSFQSDPVRFPQSSSRKHQGKPSSTTMATAKGLSVRAISERIEEVVTTERIECIGSEFNDSFDEIVSRETPSHYYSNGSKGNDDISPAGVMDVFFQSQHLQCKEKSDFLSFVDEEEESDILFTDKEEDSFLGASSSESPLHAPVFLTTSRFEI